MQKVIGISSYILLCICNFTLSVLVVIRSKYGCDYITIKVGISGKPALKQSWLSTTDAI